MKFLLAVVTALVVFTADGRHFRDEPGEQVRKTDEAQLITHETEEKGGPQYSLNGPEQGQLLEKKIKQYERKSQKPKCKISDVCWAMGGFCVTNATQCDGRLVPEGCKGKKCQCCVPGTIEAQFDKLEKSLNDSLNSQLQSLKETIDIKLQSIGDTVNATKADLGSMNIELQSMGDNLNASKVDMDSMNIELQSMGDTLNASKVDLGSMNIELHSMGDTLNASKVDLGRLNIELQSMGDNLNASKVDLGSMNIELHSMGDTLNASKADLDSEFHSLTLNLNTSFSKLNSKIDSLPKLYVCTGDFFRISGYNQCFKLLTDSPRSWEAGKTKCQQEGLLLAKPENPVALRRFIMTTYGEKTIWIGGRGSGSDVKWDRDGTIISGSYYAWHPRGYTGRTSTNHCLSLRATSSYMNSYPTKPYWSWNGCASTLNILCELV